MKTPKTKLVVLNNHTLGYILPELPNYVQHLQTSIIKGANFSVYGNFESTLISNSDNIRIASEKDFDDFRVYFCDGYKNGEYEYSI